MIEIRKNNASRMPLSEVPDSLILRRDMGREAEEKCTDQVVKGKESTNNAYCETLFIGHPALIVPHRRSFNQPALLARGAGRQHLRPPKNMGDFTNFQLHRLLFVKYGE